MIKAIGIKDNKTVTVKYESGNFTFNGKDDPAYDEEIRFMMEDRHPVGGTYYPRNADDTINIVSVLRDWFFDKPTLNISSDESVEMPSEEGDVF